MHWRVSPSASVERRERESEVPAGTDVSRPAVCADLAIRLRTAPTASDVLIALARLRESACDSFRWS